MNFQTKFDIGYTFYSPRSFRRYDTVTKVVDGNTWHRDEEWYEPLVRHKKITGVTIVANDRGTNVTYHTVTVGEDHQSPRLTDENLVTTYTYDEAMEVAKRYAENEQEYFG